MNRSLLIPRRNPRALTRLARLCGKFRYYRFIGCGCLDAFWMAWRASR